jgi:hypothetical protein
MSIDMRLARLMRRSSVPELSRSRVATSARLTRHRCDPLDRGCSEDQAAAISGHRDLNVLRGYVRESNQAKLARQAIRKQEAAG